MKPKPFFKDWYFKFYFGKDWNFDPYAERGWRTFELGIMKIPEIRERETYKSMMTKGFHICFRVWLPFEKI